MKNLYISPFTPQTKFILKYLLSEDELGLFLYTTTVGSLELEDFEELEEIFLEWKEFYQGTNLQEETEFDYLNFLKEFPSYKETLERQNISSFGELNEYISMASQEFSSRPIFPRGNILIQINKLIQPLQPEEDIIWDEEAQKMIDELTDEKWRGSKRFKLKRRMN